MNKFELKVFSYKEEYKILTVPYNLSTATDESVFLLNHYYSNYANTKNIMIFCEKLKKFFYDTTMWKDCSDSWPSIRSNRFRFIICNHVLKGVIIFHKKNKEQFLKQFSNNYVRIFKYSGSSLKAITIIDRKTRTRKDVMKKPQIRADELLLEPVAKKIHGVQVGRQIQDILEDQIESVHDQQQLSVPRKITVDDVEKALEEMFRSPRHTDYESYVPHEAGTAPPDMEIIDELLRKKITDTTSPDSDDGKQPQTFLVEAEIHHVPRDIDTERTEQNNGVEAEVLRIPQDIIVETIFPEQHIQREASVAFSKAEVYPVSEDKDVETVSTEQYLERDPSVIFVEAEVHPVPRDIDAERTEQNNRVEAEALCIPEDIIVETIFPEQHIQKEASVAFSKAEIYRVSGDKVVETVSTEQYLERDPSIIFADAEVHPIPRDMVAEIEISPQDVLKDVAMVQPKNVEQEPSVDRRHVDQQILPTDIHELEVPLQQVELQDLTANEEPKRIMQEIEELSKLQKIVSRPTPDIVVMDTTESREMRPPMEVEEIDPRKKERTEPKYLTIKEMLMLEESSAEKQSPPKPPKRPKRTSEAFHSFNVIKKMVNEIRTAKKYVFPLKKLESYIQDQSKPFDPYKLLHDSLNIEGQDLADLTSYENLYEALLNDSGSIEWNADLDKVNTCLAVVLKDLNQAPDISLAQKISEKDDRRSSYIKTRDVVSESIFRRSLFKVEDVGTQQRYTLGMMSPLRHEEEESLFLPVDTSLALIDKIMEGRKSGMPFSFTDQLRKSIIIGEESNVEKAHQRLSRRKAEQIIAIRDTNIPQVISEVPLQSLLEELRDMPILERQDLQSAVNVEKKIEDVSVLPKLDILDTVSLQKEEKLQQELQYIESRTYKKITSVDVIEKLADLYESESKPIRFTDICPKEVTSKCVAAKTFYLLLVYVVPG